jgi:hypothetical protein
LPVARAFLLSFFLDFSCYIASLNKASRARVCTSCPALTLNMEEAMFQADEPHITIAFEPAAELATSPKTKYVVTRSQVMKRAWQLAKLNRGNSTTQVASA